MALSNCDDQSLIDMALDSKEVRVEKARGRLHPEQHKDETEARK